MLEKDYEGTKGRRATGVLVAGGRAFRVTPGTRAAATLAAAARLAEISREERDERVTAITRTVRDLITERVGSQVDRAAAQRTLVFATPNAGFTWNGERMTPLSGVQTL